MVQPPAVEEHHPPADIFKRMLNPVVVKYVGRRQDFFPQPTQLRNIPLAVAQIVKEVADSCLAINLKHAVEGFVSKLDNPIWLEHQQPFTHRGHYLLQVILSIQAGTILPSTLMQRLGSHSRQSKLYQAFAEVGRVVRTLFLLEYISNTPLREHIIAETTKIEVYNSFIDWIYFGGDGTITAGDPVEQEKRIKYLNLVANAIMLQNVADMTDVLHQLAQEGFQITQAMVARLSPYLTEHIKRFGEYLLDMEAIPEPLQPDKEFLTA